MRLRVITSSIHIPLPMSQYSVYILSIRGLFVYLVRDMLNPDTKPGIYTNEGVEKNTNDNWGPAGRFAAPLGPSSFN